MTKRAWGTEGPAQSGGRLSDPPYSVAGDFSTRNSFDRFAAISRICSPARWFGDSRDGTGDILKTRQTRQAKIRVRVEERVLQLSPRTAGTLLTRLERRYR